MFPQYTSINANYFTNQQSLARLAFPNSEIELLS